MKDIKLYLKSSQTADNETDEQNFEYLGRIDRKNGKNYLMYEEDDKTAVVIKSDGETVVVSRNGAKKSIMRIKVGEETPFSYQSDVGIFDLTVVGKRTEDLLLLGNRLIFEYDLNTKFGKVSTNRIEIKIKEV